jgi:hypothetical protein
MDGFIFFARRIIDIGVEVVIIIDNKIQSHMQEGKND